MMRTFLARFLPLFAVLAASGAERPVVIADSVSRAPLANASLFDRQGNFIGIAGPDGRVPYIPADCYPATVRYLGYEEHQLQAGGPDSVFLREIDTRLPEVVIESGEHKVLHVLGYMREYSTLSTYTDTVFLFREKMVDYMFPSHKKVKFKGWSTPRVLKSKSYYRFYNARGLDSVSHVSNYHFSWSDWVGIPPQGILPPQLDEAPGSEWTVNGRFRPSEVWRRKDDGIAVDVDVLADTAGRRWVPGLSGFFRNNLDFESFKIRYSYDGAATDSIKPLYLSGYSYSIESRGRGHEMFMFNKVNEPFFVTTYAEVYILDKEYIKVKEARRWLRVPLDGEAIEIYEPAEAPALQEPVIELVARVENIDHERVRLTIEPDHRLMSRNGVNKNYRIGNRFLNILKDLTGISAYKSRKKSERNWKEFKRQWREQSEADEQ